MTHLTYFQNVWCSNLCFCIVIFLPFKNISNLNDAIWLSVIFTYMYFPSWFFLVSTISYTQNTIPMIKYYDLPFFLLLFSRLRLQRRIIKKMDVGHFDITTAILVSTSSWFVCICGLFFFIHALLKKQNKNFAELNYCDFYFIVFPFDALENKFKKNVVIFRSPE